MPTSRQLYAFGARSFSVWNADVAQLFDSGDALEQLTSARTRRIPASQRVVQLDLHQQHERPTQRRTTGRTTTAVTTKDRSRRT